MRRDSSNCLTRSHPGSTACRSAFRRLPARGGATAELSCGRERVRCRQYRELHPVVVALREQKLADTSERVLLPLGVLRVPEDVSGWNALGSWAARLTLVS